MTCWRGREVEWLRNFRMGFTVLTKHIVEIREANAHEFGPGSEARDTTSPDPLSNCALVAMQQGCSLAHRNEAIVGERRHELLRVHIHSVQRLRCASTAFRASKICSLEQLCAVFGKVAR